MEAKSALQGVRILDFGSFLAGPLASMMLAQMGAEVIKVENPNRPDGARFFNQSPGWPPADHITGTQFFNLNNMGKKSLAIDLSTDAGKEIILEVAKQMDVILENMRPGAIDRIGLGYDVVKTLNSGIVFVSSSACGNTGPDRDFVGYASLFANKVGLGIITGDPGAKPGNFAGPMDARSAACSVIAILTGLIHRELTGEGQYIDVSSQEAIALQLGDAYLDCAVNGSDPVRTGNHRPSYAPNNAYQADAEDQWVTLSIRFDQNKEWRELCDVIGCPGLAEKYPDYESRYANQEEIDREITKWTVGQNHMEAMKLLQSRGIPAGVTMHGYDYFSNEHFTVRYLFDTVPHRFLGEDWYTKPCWRYSDTPCAELSAAPLLGADTDELLEKYAKLSPEQISGLKERKVIFSLDASSYMPKIPEQELAQRERLRPRL